MVGGARRFRKREHGRHGAKHLLTNNRPVVVVVVVVLVVVQHDDKYRTISRSPQRRHIQTNCYLNRLMSSPCVTTGEGV